MNQTETFQIIALEKAKYDQRLRGLILKYRKDRIQGYRIDKYDLDWETVEQDLINVITDDYTCEYKDKPKKIYISGMITGIETLAPELFAKAEARLKEEGYFPINPMKLPHLHDKSWLNFMREDLKSLCDCDGIYMMSNYMNSRGAMIELELAMKLGLQLIYENKKLKEN